MVSESVPTCTPSSLKRVPPSPPPGRRRRRSMRPASARPLGIRAGPRVQRSFCGRTREGLGRNSPGLKPARASRPAPGPAGTPPSLAAGPAGALLAAFKFQNERFQARRQAARARHGPGQRPRGPTAPGAAGDALASAPPARPGPAAAGLDVGRASAIKAIIRDHCGAAGAAGGPGFPTVHLTDSEGSGSGIPPSRIPPSQSSVIPRPAGGHRLTVARAERRRWHTVTVTACRLVCPRAGPGQS